MGAEYNWVMDSVPIRVAINVTLFGFWLAGCVALLAI